DGDPLTHKINALKEDPDGSLGAAQAIASTSCGREEGCGFSRGLISEPRKEPAGSRKSHPFCGMTAATCGSAASAAFIGFGPMAEWNATRPSTACLMVTSCHFSWIAGGCYGPGPGEASAGSSRIPIPPAASSSGSTPPKTAFPAIL